TRMFDSSFRRAARERKWSRTWLLRLLAWHRGRLGAEQRDQHRGASVRRSINLLMRQRVDFPFQRRPLERLQRAGDQFACGFGGDQVWPAHEPANQIDGALLTEFSVNQRMQRAVELRTVRRAV